MGIRGRLSKCHSGQSPVCYERNHLQAEWKRCFTRDEGRPLEVGVQAQTSNRRKLRRLRVFVVNVAGKGGA